MNKIAYVVLSFDNYSDLWPTCFECKEKFWRSRMPTYLVTNNKKPEFENVQVITTGPEISWSHRAKKAIQEITEEYILLMLEDYFVISVIDDGSINPFVSFMEATDADYLRIYPFPTLKFKDKGIQGIHPIPKESLYGVNLQPAIWKRDYLLKLLEGPDISAWEFEARQKNGVDTQVNGNLYTVDYSPFKMVNGVLQGKWYAPAIKDLKKVGINVDTKNRDILSQDKVLIYKSKILIRKIMGPKLIRKFKPLLKKCGIKFVTD